MDLQVVISLVCFGTVVVVLGALAAFLWKAPVSVREPERRTRWVVLAVLVVWAGIALAVGYWGELSFVTFLPFALVPIAVGSAVTFTPGMQAVLVRVPTHWMVVLQCYRVAGGVFLYAYYFGDDVLSRGFAFNAGWGDVLTGVLAAPVGYMVMRRTPWHGVALMLWSIIGIGDLILAPISVQLYGARDLVTFPLNIIPLFLGPPLGILLHIVTLRIYYLRKHAAT